MYKLKVLGIVWVTVMGLSVGGCFKREMTAQQYLESAKAFYAEADYARARVQLRNALRKKETLAQAYYYLALVAEKNDNIFIAFADINRAQELAPEDTDIAIKAAEYWVLTVQFKKAVAAMTSLLKQPDRLSQDQYAKAYPVLIAGLIGLQQYPQALQSVDEGLLKVDAQDDNALHELRALKIVALKFLARFDEALELVNRLRAARPDDINAELLRLEINELKGDTSGVEAALQRLMVLDPEQARYPLALAQRFYQRQRVDEAINILEQYNQQQPTNTLVKRALLEVLEHQEPGRASALLNTFLEQLPNDTGLIFYRAGLLLRGNQLADAGAALQSLVASPQLDIHTQTKAQLLLASVLRAEGKQSQALTLLNDALSSSPLNADLLALRARVALDLQRYDIALKDAQSVLSQQVDNIEALELTGHIYGVLGDKVREAKTYEHILQLAPNHAKARSIHIRELIKAQKFSAAQRYLSSVTPADRQTADWQLRHLELLMAQKLWPQASVQLDALEQSTVLDWRLVFLRAKIALGQGELAHAKALFQQVLQEQPAYVEAYSGLASVVESNKGVESVEVIRWLAKLIEQNPTAVPAYALKAKLERSVGRNAVATFRQGVLHNVNWLQGYKLLADEQLFNGRHQAAIDVYNQALEQHPLNGFLLLSQALLYQKVKQYSRAQENYETLLTQSNSLVVRNNYALLLVDTPALRNEQSIRKAVQITADFVDTDRYEFLDTYGWVQFWAGDLKAAEHTLRVALKNTAHLDVKYHLARVYQAQKNDSALEQLLHELPLEQLPEQQQVRFKALMFTKTE
ncbi:tetratricopeptide repeat protein [Marinagarivorans algicola]|uniref:tetratricopeptide repeat protein n=1 Tax=Marinagarivorans algicola TaxID=1513270 RepID=UPI0037365C21